jgi:hypothetical protein
VRWPPFDVTLLRTADFACSKSGKARVSAIFFLSDFGIGDGLLDRRLIA